MNTIHSFSYYERGKNTDWTILLLKEKRERPGGGEARGLRGERKLKANLSTLGGGGSQKAQTKQFNVAFVQKDIYKNKNKSPLIEVLSPCLGAAMRTCF